MIKSQQASSAWVPVGLVSQVHAKSAHPVILNDEMLALWRDEDGHLQVWEDRCPHRGMRLSFGFVEGQRLTCLYHGWQYGRTGACKYIPAHPEMAPPETIKVRSCPVALAYGMILTSVSAAAETPPTASDGDWQGVRSIYLARPAQDVADYLGRGQQIASVSLTQAGALFTSDTIAVGLQSIDPNRSALHVAARQLPLSARVDLARELVALRHDMDEMDHAA